MRAHTESGTGPVLALAPEPTAAWFVGKRRCGSAPARGTGASLVLAGGVACVGDGVLRRDAVAVVGFGVSGVPLVSDGVGIGVGVGVDVDRATAGLVPASPAVGEPAPHPARARQVRARERRVRARERRVRVVAGAVALLVLLRRIVRSVSSVSRPIILLLYAASSILSYRRQSLGKGH